MRHKIQNPECKIQNTRQQVKNQEADSEKQAAPSVPRYIRYETQNTKYWLQNAKYKTKSQELWGRLEKRYEIQNTKYKKLRIGSQSREKIWDTKYKITKHKIQKVENWKSEQAGEKAGSCFTVVHLHSTALLVSK